MTASDAVDFKDRLKPQEDHRDCAMRLMYQEIKKLRQNIEFKIAEVTTLNELLAQERIERWEKTAAAYGNNDREADGA